MKKYGSLIAKLRKKNNLTQAQLGEKLNISYQAVSKWENNLSEPDLVTIEKLAYIFNITVSEFFDMANDPDKLYENKPSITNTTVYDTKLKFKFGKFVKSKPWYLVAGLGCIILLLSLVVALIPIKYSSSKIYKMVDPSVFCVTLETESGKQAGSGFFINDKGLAVTNYHVIENAIRGKVQLNNGKIYTIKKIVGYDKNLDIAIIQIDIKKSKPVRLGNSDKIKVGDTVYAIGYPEPFALGTVDSTLTKGIISKKSYTDENNTYIQTTVDITHGNSGGVLVNQEGKVIGITTAGISIGNVNYMNLAIPSNKIKKVKRNLNITLEQEVSQHKDYTLTYMSDGNIFDTETVPYDNLVENKTISKTGYQFKGWYTDETYTQIYDFNQGLKNNTTVYAKWEANKYYVRFIYENNSYEQQFIYDQYQNLMPNAFIFPEHFHFVNWRKEDSYLYYQDGDMVKNLTTVNGGVVKFNARIEEDYYYIRYNPSNIVDLDKCSEHKLNYSQEAKVPTNVFSKVGYLFKHWVDSQGNIYENKYVDGVYQGDILTKLVSENEGIFDLFAVWEEITYKIYYRNSRDVLASIYIDTLTYEEEFVLGECPFTCDGYEFSHYEIWQKSYNIGDKVSKLSTQNNTNVSITAMFIPKNYTIIYDGNGADSGEMENQLATFDSPVTLKNSQFTRDGYIFRGWIYNDTLHIDLEVDELITTYHETIILKADWVENLKGEGTKENPYKVATVEDLDKWSIVSLIEDMNGKYVELSNDIDCNYKKLKSINFAGCFDGKGHRLINVDYEDNALFKYNYGTIQNFGIENLKIERIYNDNSKIIEIAGLVYNNYADVSNCYVKGLITIQNQADISVAGLVLNNKRNFPLESIPSIRFCYTDIIINATATNDINNCNIFGLVGNDDFQSTTSYSYSISNIITNLKSVDRVIINAFSKNETCLNTFAKTTTIVNIESVPTYCSFDQHVDFYSDDSNIKVTINGNIKTDYITSFTSASNLMNKEWMQNNLFNIDAIWNYTNDNYPTLTSTIENISLNSQEEFLSLNNMILYNNYTLNVDINLDGIQFQILENNGIFNGNGHIVDDLNIQQHNINGKYSLFRDNLGIIKNLGITNLNINLKTSGKNITGGLTAYNTGTINACFVKGVVSVENTGSYCEIGGIAGLNYGDIRNCYSVINITGSNNNSITGGAISGSGSGIIENCYSSGIVDIYNDNYSTTLRAFGITSGYNTLVKNSFCLSNVVVGGITMLSTDRGSISRNSENCYSYQYQTVTSNGVTSYPSNRKPLTTLCSRTFLTSLGFSEWINIDKLQENENAVWTFNSSELPKLWFDV